MYALPNIEPHPLRPGQHVGYSRLGVHRIRRRNGPRSGWLAARYVGGQDAGDGFVYAPTLKAMSAKLFAL